MISSLTFYTKAHHPTESMSQENENLKCKVYNIIISLYHEACTNPEQENDPVSKKLEPFENMFKVTQSKFQRHRNSKDVYVFFAGRGQK